MEQVRALRADEIECRVNQVSEKGVTLLLYKDARCDMAILDETYGSIGWKRKHDFINGKEYCTISVFDKEINQWIDKQDCGTESNTEKEKGQSSDAFKRAGVNWGIGRELYTKIFIFIKVETKKISTQNGKDKYEMVNKFEKFIVSGIETENKAKKILKLEIADKKGNIVFKWSNDNPPVYDDIEEKDEPLIVCNKCKEKITSCTSKGITHSPQETFDKLGGLCKKCFREKNNIQGG